MTSSAHEIDFLPADFRQCHARRRSQPWRIVVLAGFGALVVAGAVGQQRRRTAIEAELLALAPQHAAAVAQSARLDTLRAELAQVQADAELYSYLRHPWPRTQILRTALAPLPAEVTLDELEIKSEPTQSTAATPARSAAEKQAETEKLAPLPAAARDLKHFREVCDNRDTTVSLVGTTSDSAALHGYLAALRKAELVAAVALPQIEIAESPGRLRFRVTLQIRPGYGQPGGPTGPLSPEAHPVPSASAAPASPAAVSAAAARNAQG